MLAGQFSSLTGSYPHAGILSGKPKLTNHARLIMLATFPPASSWILKHEADISTEQIAAQTYARIPRAHAHQRWAPRDKPPSRQGQSEALSLNLFH